ncbi:MAG: thioesterase [Brevinematales bacterium]|nr:thioesterase [Brevinematales bacterium]
MTPRYENRYDIRFTEKSPVGTITMATLCRYLLEVANDHASQLGVDFESMFRHDLTWAIVRFAMEIPSNLSELTEIIVTTWPAEQERLYVYRDYEIFSPSKDLLARATSQWIVLNKTTRKPVRPPKFLSEIYHHLYKDTIPSRYDFSFTQEWSHRDKTSSHVYETSLIVRRSDTDLNGHTNTAAYIEFMEESIPLAMYHNHQPRYFELLCLAESFEKEEILSLSEISSDGKEILHTLIRKHNHTILARGKSLWN